jgi:nitrogen fixation protein NifQ
MHHDSTSSVHNEAGVASLKLPTALQHLSPAAALRTHMCNADDIALISIIGAIESAYEHGLPTSEWLRGFNASGWTELLDQYFPGARFANAQLAACCSDGLRAECSGDIDAEFSDLLNLLKEAIEPSNKLSQFVACAVASASLFDNHLWEDLHLPNRAALSALLNQHFSSLAQRNTGNMRWKAFFYKQLCERAGMTCRSPSCGACDDYALCFGPEEPGTAN